MNTIIKRTFSIEPSFNNRVWAAALTAVASLSFLSHLKSEYHKFSNKKLKYMLRQKDKENYNLRRVVSILKKQ